MALVGTRRPSPSRSRWTSPAPPSSWRRSTAIPGATHARPLLLALAFAIASRPRVGMAGRASGIALDPGWINAQRLPALSGPGRRRLRRSRAGPPHPISASATHKAPRRGRAAGLAVVPDGATRLIRSSLLYVLDAPAIRRRSSRGGDRLRADTRSDSPPTSGRCPPRPAARAPAGRAGRGRPGRRGVPRVGQPRPARGPGHRSSRGTSMVPRRARGRRPASTDAP